MQDVTLRPVPASEKDVFTQYFQGYLSELARLNGVSPDAGGVLQYGSYDRYWEDEARMPVEIVVADQTGNFVEYQRPLAYVASAYAAPINRRAEHVPDAGQFARVYLDAFAARFSSTQEKYRRKRQEFDLLFHHRPRDENGSIAFRWEKVLKRLDQSDPQELRRLICESVDAI